MRVDGLPGEQVVCGRDDLEEVCGEPKLSTQEQKHHALRDTNIGTCSPL